MSDKFPSQMQDKFTVRFPDGLRDAIAERAKANGRSMNSEIVQILEDALNAKVIAWDESLSPKPGGESITMSMEQLNKVITTTAEEAVDAVAKKLAEKYTFHAKR
ncbi:Arc family DNA-binding protein [Pluralibacter gergoviae]|uniref:Arc family DNA-binding protein n=1 Tax=Pluralibacter gergoviae TaxID=61647 RepID=UPI002908C0DF|nr:Arc family DNA-binding protein [Pluralibacter gergoviae]MDU4001448.1 Arc family DNA-binding protein [Pluralibacter gergoviae]